MSVRDPVAEARALLERIDACLDGDAEQRFVAAGPRLLAALCDELVLSRKVIGALDFLDSVAAETPILQPGEMENASRIYDDARGALESWRDLQGDVPASTDEQFARIAATTKLIETAMWYRDARAKLEARNAERNAVRAAWQSATPSMLEAVREAFEEAQRDVVKLHGWLLAAALAMPEKEGDDR